MPLKQKFYRHSQRQATSCCTLGQLGSKSAGFGLVPEIWSESLYVSERRLWKDWEKKTCRFPAMHRNCAHTHAHAPFLSFSSFFPCFASSLWTADRQDSSYSKTKKQTNDYIRHIFATKIHFADRGLCTRTHTDTHTHTHTRLYT